MKSHFEKSSAIWGLLVFLSASIPDAHGAPSSSRPTSTASARPAGTKSDGTAHASYFSNGMKDLDDFQPSKAISNFSRAFLSVKSAPNSSKSKIFLLIGRSFQYDENERAAAQAFSIAHALNPADQVATAYLAHSLSRCGHRPDAQPYYQWLKAQKDKTRTTLEILALEAAKTADIESAKKYMEVALAQPGGQEDPYLHYIYAKFLSKTGETEKSRVQFGEAAAKMPSPYIKTLLLATLQRIAANADKQIELLKEAGKFKPNEPGWHYELADCYAARGDKRAAVDQYNLALQGRFSGRACARAITFLRNEHRYKEALQISNELIKRKPWSSDAHQTLASIYFAQKEYEKADREARLAIQLDRYNETAYVELGRQCVEQKKLEEARQVYKQGLANSPKSLALLRRLGDLESKLNNEAAARQCYLKIIAQVPDLNNVNVIFQNEYAVAQAKLGSCYYAGNERDKALKAAKLFNRFKFVPKLPPLLTLLHLRPGRLEEGKTATEQDYNSHILLADMLREGGRLDDCIAEYRKAEAINDDDVDLHSYLLNALDEKGDMLEAARENVILSSKLVNRMPAQVKKFATGKDSQQKPAQPTEAVAPAS